MIQPLLSVQYKDSSFRIIDSIPKIMAKYKRRFNAKVVPELADKNGYCSTKKLFYYGVKLHLISCDRVFTIPLTENMILTQAG